MTGMSGHESSRRRTDEWLTPSAVVGAQPIDTGQGGDMMLA